MSALHVASIGPGRSGTTWAQRYLSTLPGVLVHGQPTVFPWAAAVSIYRNLLTNCGAARAHNLPFSYQHHMEATSEMIRLGVRALIENVWYDGRPFTFRGVKLGGVRIDAPYVDELLEPCRWVAMARDPHKQYKSLRRTFQPMLAWLDFLTDWCHAANAAQDAVLEGRAFIFHIDRGIGYQSRELCDWLGLPFVPPDPTPEHPGAATPLLDYPETMSIPDDWRSEVVESLGYG